MTPNNGYEVVVDRTQRVVDYAATWDIAARRADGLTRMDRILHTIRPIKVLQEV